MAESLLFEVSGTVWEALRATMLIAVLMLLFAFMMQLELREGRYINWILYHWEFVERREGDHISYIPFAKVVAPFFILVSWALLSWQIISVVFHFSPGNWLAVLILILVWSILFVLFNLTVSELLEKKRLKNKPTS